jgi:hypothetical protein
MKVGLHGTCQLPCSLSRLGWSLFCLSKSKPSFFPHSGCWVWVSLEQRSLCHGS